MRSLLFVPADSDRKLEKSLVSGTDALIIDLEDSIAPTKRPAARERARDFLISTTRLDRRPRLFVRVNGLATGETEADLDAVMPAAPDGIVLPKSRHGADVQHLGAKLAVREAEHGLADGGTSILAIATETAGSLFGLGSYTGSSHRLMGLAWGAEDLSAALGAEASRTEAGILTGPFRLARDLTLIGARAAMVEPVDTVFVDFRDDAGLRTECEAARRDGFTCKLAIHPAQVAIINACFTPSAAARAAAQAVVDAFAAAPDAGTISIDGQMFDRPHLLRARRILARSGE
jgi:citrate lyase subunit beta/citryl-CoA lyase